MLGCPLRYPCKQHKSECAEQQNFVSIELKSLKNYKLIKLIRIVGTEHDYFHNHYFISK